MTDSSLAQLTQVGLNTISHTDHTLILSLPRANELNGTTLEDEEDGVIKCFCDYQEDDGATVLCEKCNTWQHIECYYASSLDVPEVHECADCEPRTFDARRATERQRKKREQNDTNLVQKVKKSSTKSHKKKTKAPEGYLQQNGLGNDRDDAALRIRATGCTKEHAQSIRTPKANHKISNSIHSSTIFTQPSAWGGKRSASASHTIRSPSKSSHTNSPDLYRLQPYSPEFLHLYDNDPGEAPLKANLFNDITITDQLQLWSHDVEALGEATNGKQPQEIFQRCDLALDSMIFPEIRKEHKQDESLSVCGTVPRWTMLKIDVDIPQNSIVGELMGQIGHMNNYVQDPANRWDYLRHPAPFVFFHEQLPIYIDTRREGTICRYLRRSCRPNLSLRTFLQGSDYHFCFVANQDLPAGTELTTGWRLDQHIRSFLHGNDTVIKQEGLEDSGRHYISDWVGKVFAEFGDCACNHPEGCIFQRYDPRSPTSVNDTRRGGKNNATLYYQTWSTGKINDSRSGSEGVKRFDGEDDSQSLSGSTSRSPRSRDVTPTKSGLKARGGVPEMSGREKRKIENVERSFEQMEQKKSQPNKKRKRTSGGSNVQTPSTMEIKPSSRFVNSGMTPQVATVKIPISPKDSPSLLQGCLQLAARERWGNIKSKVFKAKPRYADATTQTNPDPVNDVVNFIHRPPKNLPRYESLHKRLMRRAREQQTLLKQMRDHWFLEHPDHPETVKHRIKLGDCTARETGKHLVCIDRAENGCKSLLSGDTIEVHDVSHELSPSFTTFPPYGKSSPSQISSSLVSAKEAIQEVRVIPPLPPEPKAPPNPRPTPLSVLLPPPPLFSSTTKTAVARSSTPPPIPSATPPDFPTVRNPNSYPPLPLAASLSSSGTTIQPSPIKKISIGDYLSRRSSHKVETLASTFSATHQEKPDIASPTIVRSIPDESKAVLGSDSVIFDNPKVESLPVAAPQTEIAQHTSKEQWMDIDVPPQLA